MLLWRELLVCTRRHVQSANMLLLVSIKKDYIVRIAFISWHSTRIQGHCISEKECPLKHPAREDDGYVPLHQNTSVCTYTCIGWIVFEPSHIHMLHMYLAKQWG